MKTRATSPAPSFKNMPADYGILCRSVWLPRPIRDKADHAAALAAIEPLWGHEKAMNQDQADWFEMVANLIADVLEAPAGAANLARAGAAVNSLCAKFPVYGPAMHASYGMK